MGTSAAKPAAGSPGNTPFEPAAPCARPLKSAEELLQWRPSQDPHTELCRATVPLPPACSAASLQRHPRLLACHDLAGGYGPDRYPQGCTESEFYGLRNWSNLHTFIYFSHTLVTIPPPGYINAAHLHGVQVLGTLIAEWEAGAGHCRTLFGSAAAAEEAATQLAAIAQHYGFEGWLINIECKMDVEHIPHLLHFLRLLTQLMRQVAPGCSEVMWYDAVTIEGRLKWQNSLNALNRPFFDACDSIFINYGWKKRTPALVREEAGERCGAVFMGIDCFGRGTYGGGGFNCEVALTACLEAGLSAALFAPGWPFEGDCGRDAPACWRQRDALFWRRIEAAWEAGAAEAGPGSSLGQNSCRRLRPATAQLPLFSDFSVGSGRSMHLAGQRLSAQPWYNLSLQALQPLLRVQLTPQESMADKSSGGGDRAGDRSWVQADISQGRAFSRGSCVSLQGILRGGQLAIVQLYRTAVPLPAGGFWMRWTASADPIQSGAELRLALRLVRAGGTAGGTAGGHASTIVELAPLQLTDPTAALPAASSCSSSTAVRVIAASGRHVTGQAIADGVEAEGPRDASRAGGTAAEAAGAVGARAVPHHWVTWEYFLGAEALAVAAAGTEASGPTAAAGAGEAAGEAGPADDSTVQLLGVDAVLLGTGPADGKPSSFQAFIGELSIEEAVPGAGPPAPPGCVEQLRCSNAEVTYAPTAADDAAAVLTARLDWRPPTDGPPARRYSVWCSFDTDTAGRWLGTASTTQYWARVRLPLGSTAATLVVQSEGCNGLVQDLAASARVEVSLAAQQVDEATRAEALAHTQASIMATQSSPGKNWGVRSLRSGFGEQPTSNRASAPAAGFGSSSRDAYQKQFASAEVDRVQARSRGNIDNPLGACYAIPDTMDKQVLSTVASPPRVRFGTGKRPSMALKTDVPGPGAYKMKPTIGDTVESTRASAPRTKFGSGSRDQANRLYISSEHEKCQVGVDSPGPAYTVHPALGKQLLSTRKSAGAFVMPKGDRFTDNDVREAAGKPGAGAYNLPSSIGNKTDKSAASASTLRNSPTIRFGTSTRDQDAKVFISQEHEKGSYGSCSPGPITANPASSMGRQVLSTKSSGSMLGFGSSKRLVQHATDVPGPGAYYA
ncbi:Cytosolic endo-beta-N-acetylglucosaminidase 2 [Chlorella vulgaris]